MDDEAIWGRDAPGAAPTPPPPPPARRRPPALLGALAALVVIVVVVGIAGFVVVRRGGGTGGEDRLTSETPSGRARAAAALAAATGASRAAGTARIRTTMRAFDGGHAIDEKVAGTVGLGTAAYDLTFTIDGAPDLPFGSAPGLTEERAISDGTTVWATIPPGLADIPQVVPGPKAKNPLAGKRYVAFKAGQSDHSFGLTAATPIGFSIGSAPGDVLGYLSSVGTAVEEGREQIDGQDVTRYQADLDIDALQRALPSEQRTFDAYDFKPDVPHTLPAKVWLDGDGRLRRLTYRIDLATLLTDVALKADHAVEECPEPDPALVTRAEAGDQKAMAALIPSESSCPERPARPEELITEGSVDLTDYGTALAVTPPPAGEVVTEEQMTAFLTAQAARAVPRPAGPTSTARPRTTKSSATTKP